MKRIAFVGTMLVAGSLLIGACVKQGNDAPPDVSGYDPGLTVTTTIAQLKAMNPTNGDTERITQDLVIAGVVTADDRSGNFYKQIVIQDSTGGLSVDIDAYSLYNDYPVGRKIYIKVKGLYLGYNGGLPELGSSVTEQKAINGITGNEITDHIVKANVGNTVKDTVITVAQALSGNPFFFSRLVTVTDAEFVDTTKTYTEATATTNRFIATCAMSSTTANQLTVRNSNYANFHAIKLPSGHGSLTGIMTVFISGTRVTPQLVLRDTTDVKLYETRCGGGGTPSTSALITLDSMRKLYPGTGNFTMPNVKITGIVISDIDNKNVSAGNFIIEDNSRKGAIFYIPGSTAFKLGDSVVVEMGGTVLKLYNNALEVDNLTAAKVTRISSGKTITPTTVTIATLNSNFTNYESTLVKIQGASITTAGTYSGNKNLDDGTGTIVLRTSTTATFAGDPVVTTQKNYIGIATIFTTTKQLGIRNLGDVQ